MNKIFLLFLCIIFLTSLSSADLLIETTSSDYHTLNQDKYLNAQVYNASTGLLVPTSLLSCQYILYSQDGSSLLNNGTLTPEGTEFTAVIPSIYFTTTGYYSTLISCNSTDEGSFSKVPFLVTPTGDEATTATSVMYIGLLFIVVLGFILLCYFGVTTESLPLKAASLGFGYLFLIGISFMSWTISTNFIIHSSFLTAFLYWIFLVLMIGFFPFLLGLFVYGVYMMLTVQEIRDMVERGIPEGEAMERSKWRK